MPPHCGNGWRASSLSAKPDRLLAPAYGGGVGGPLKSFRDVTPYGHVGDPSLATPETGHALYEAICDWMVRVVERDLVG